MSIELKATENIQTYDIELNGKIIDGEITNRTSNGKFAYKTDDFPCELSEEELIAIAEKLREFNEQ
jgi:hypothetical protein